MSWLYLSDPDNREMESDADPPPYRPPLPRPAAVRPSRRPVKGHQGRYQFVLPGFDDLVGHAAYNPRVRRRVP